MNVQSQVSLCALHQTTPIKTQLINMPCLANGPEIWANRISAIKVTTASAMPNSDAYSTPSSIEMRAISTMAMVNMAKMKCIRISC